MLAWPMQFSAPPGLGTARRIVGAPTPAHQVHSVFAPVQMYVAPPSSIQHAHMPLPMATFDSSSTPLMQPHMSGQYAHQANPNSFDQSAMPSALNDMLLSHQNGHQRVAESGASAHMTTIKHTLLHPRLASLVIVGMARSFQ